MGGIVGRLELDRAFFLRTISVAILFFMVYLAISWISSSFDPRFYAIMAALPLIFGILWGFSAAFGIIIAGIVLTPMMTDDLFYAAEYVLIYATVALCSYRCFHSLKKPDSNDYIYDASSMMSFFVSVMVMVIEFYSSLKFVFFDDSEYLGSFSSIFFSTIWVSLIFGIVLLILISFFYRAPSIPHHEQTGRWRYALFALFVIPVVFLLSYEHIPYDASWMVVTVDIVVFAIIGVLGPSQPVVYNAEEFHSMKFKTFVKIFAVALVLSLLFDVFIESLSLFMDLGDKDVSDTIFVFRAFSRSTIILAFILVAFLIERYVTTPIYDITSRIRRDGENNEFDVISNRLDFIAGNKEAIDGNEFSLFIGLTKRDGSAQHSSDDAKRTIDAICLRYVGGYISNEGKGGYKGGDSTVSEDVLVYKIFGATDDQINRIVEDVLKELDQESVLVEKNGVSRWYCYADTE